MLELIVAFLIMFSVTVLCVAILSIPILIANARGICGTDHTIIVVLSILGVLFGVTWFIALIFSVVWQGECMVDTDLDKLEKAAKLYKNKLITKEEYEKIKSKLLSKK